MEKYKEQTLSYIGAFGITACLLLLLLFVDSVFYSPPEEPSRRGAIKLSSYERAPTQEDSTSVEEVPEVPTLEKMAEVDMTLETPTMEMVAPSMIFDFAPEVAGTIAIAGVPSLSAAAAPAAMSGGAFSLGDVDELPRPIYAPTPAYPSHIKNRTKETLRVRVLLGTDGKVMRVTPVNVKKSQVAFFEEVQATVMRWEFTPCKKGGKAVLCVAEQPFVFSPK